MKNEGNLLISEGGSAVMRSLPGGGRNLRFMSHYDSVDTVCRI